jgi:hypothetical protein
MYVCLRARQGRPRMSMNYDSTACARTLSIAWRQAPRLIYFTVLYACIYPPICCNRGCEKGHVRVRCPHVNRVEPPTLEDIATHAIRECALFTMLCTTPAICMYLPVHFMFAAGCCIPWPVTRAMQVPGSSLHPIDMVTPRKVR